MTQRITFTTWSGTYSREVTLHLADTAAEPTARYTQMGEDQPVSIWLRWAEEDYDGNLHPVDLKLIAYDPQTIRAALEAALSVLPPMPDDQAAIDEGDPAEVTA